MPPVNRNLTMQIRRALYSLKRDYGARIDIYKLDSSSTDERTGVKTITKTMYPIPRGIVMPEKRDRVAQQSISLISSNKEFVSGGSYDAGTRDFIIDRRDCPTLPVLTADDWIVYNREKYQIKNVESFEVNAGWIVTAKKLAGEVPEQIFYAKADNLLAFETETATEVDPDYRGVRDQLQFVSAASATVG
jgi:hypothetical protein